MNVTMTMWTVCGPPHWLPFGRDVNRWVTTYTIRNGRLANKLEKL